MLLPHLREILGMQNENHCCRCCYRFVMQLKQRNCCGNFLVFIQATLAHKLAVHRAELDRIYFKNVEVTNEHYSIVIGKAAHPGTRVMDSAIVTVASDMQSFTYNEQCIPNAKFRYFMAALFQDTLDLLFDDLLFCLSDLMLPLCPLHSLKDEVEDGPNSLKSGYSFLTEPDNVSILQPGFTNVITNLEEIPNGGNLLISRMAECSLIDFSIIITWPLFLNLRF